MDKIIFATSNKGKLKEIKEIMGDKYEIISLAETGITAEIDENGTTFEENALIKARTIAKETNMAVLSDDSGLEVDYLNKAPGVHSARYMGENTPYTIKNNSIIQQLDGVPNEKRTARFVCVIACVLPDGREITVRSTVEGIIGYEEKGENGFGYDPIFYLPQYKKTTAELSPEEKNKISHRGKALCMMKERLREIKL